MKKGYVYRYFQHVIALWIAYFEGFWIPDSRAKRNNNPGNLKGWSSNLPKDPQGFDIFPDIQSGWGALIRQVELNIDRELTVWQFFNGKPFVYPGYSATDSKSYARFIANKTGLPLESRSILSVIDSIQQRFSENSA